MPTQEQVNRGIESIRQAHIKHPRFQAQHKVSPSELVGSAELAWRRGHQTGAYDSIKKLRRKHPEAAKYLQKYFCMDNKGNLGATP